MSQNNSRKVYSSEHGKLCPTCGEPEARCRCQQNQAQQKRGDGRVRVQREMKGRGGKTVTVIRGLALSAPEMKELATALKRRFGTGGSVKGDQVELQGDYADKVVEELNKLGHNAKRAGG